MRGRPRTRLTPLKDKTLPEELWAEVLARLPVKTLLKFRSVCKSWCSLIDSPNFISMHLSLCKNNHEKPRIISLGYVGNRKCKKLILTTHKVDTFRKSGEICSFPFSFDVEVKGYVNGLMLLYRRYEFPYSEVLMLWNPSIRKSLMLPGCPAGHELNTILLGYDHVSNDYKVVVLDTQDSLAAIYELSKGSWRTKRIEYKVDDDDVLLFESGRGVCCKGVIYWLPNDCDLLFSFDLGTETLSRRELPSEGNDFSSKIREKFAFVLGDSLALYVTRFGGFCIWVMKDGELTEWFRGSFLVHSCHALSDFFYVETRDVLFINVKTAVSALTGRRLVKVLRKFPHDLFVVFMDTLVESLVLASGSSEGKTVKFLSDLENDKYPGKEFDDIEVEW